MTVANRRTPPPGAPTAPAVNRQSASQLLSVALAAARLGLKPSTIRCWILLRKCPVVHSGRAVRIPSDWIEDYIRRHTTPPLPEREQ